MREHKDGWKTQVRQERENSELNGVPGGVGTVSAPSSRFRHDSFPTGRANSDQSNTSAINPGLGSAGEVARQLIDKAQKQLAYYKKQVCELEAIVDELNQFTEALEAEKSEESEQQE